MQRTSVDGSFEREILKASSLQGSVPLAEEVRPYTYQQWYHGNSFKLVALFVMTGVGELAKERSLYVLTVPITGDHG